MLDGNDVAKLIECAIRHPASNMRYAVLAAVWNHPDSFRQIFQFGLRAPPGLPEIRKIVAEELDRPSAKSGISGFKPGQAGRRAAATSDAPACASARSRWVMSEARCSGRMPSAAWSRTAAIHTADINSVVLHTGIWLRTVSSRPMSARYPCGRKCRYGRDVPCDRCR
jgi:hypothetical protein